MGGVVSVVDAFDAPNDMNDCTLESCNAQGVPSSIPAPMNAACGTGGTGACNGFGMCLSALGSVCADGGACASGFCTDGVCCVDTCTGECMACNVTGAAGTCTNVPSNSDDAPLCTGTNSCDGMGTCKRDNGQACGMGMDCSSGFCADGVCCDTACGDTCKSCNLMGTVGVCTLVPNDKTDPTGAMPCNNPYRCDGTGLCKGLNSVSCTLATDCLSGYCVDGYCCGNDCTQLCKACSGALTGGANGSCLPILNGNDPQMECPNGDCNGAGMCTGGGGGNQTNGTACSAAGQCASGYCIDGICCGAGCTESCKTCNLAGQLGTCVNVPSGQVDNTGAMPCNNGHQCNGAGVCQGVNGVPCMTGGECVSTYCVDGVCCNNSCNQLCKSCSFALGTLPDGTCSFTKIGTDPDNECSGATPNCTGAGVCGP